MIRVLALALLVVAVTLQVFGAAAMAAEPDVRPIPLMGVPVMTGLSRVSQSAAVFAAPSASIDHATVVVRDDVATTARKTLSDNEEVVSPQ
ncbi:hypothetical protein [Burkholderia pseudomallei]|uniref:Uncharacterized protein n=1 Tax=Burkholderia pseudomallei TaxID=28450 RepID=A0AA40MH89_BURPE|nr:hypothetical protein [Burkholderia pseudomallei]KGS77560.1 hypothetical protein X942_4636 [Burkholderia pseudomallei MSHR5596]KGX17037.1 hypothetical protein Y036_6021 [Burkholderia pseudomallei]